MVMRFHADFSEWNQLSQDFLAQAKAAPPLAREFLNLAGQDGVDIVQMVYETEPNPEAMRRLPVYYHGELGEGFSYQVAAGTKRQWVTILNDIAHMQYVEGGRGPGSVPVDLIKEWASDKLGLDPESRAVQSIISGIKQFGVEADHLMARALGRGTNGGIIWDRRISARLDQFVARLLGSGR